MTRPPAADGAAVTEALGRLCPVPIVPEYAAGVMRWIGVLAGHIATIDAVELGDAAEPASVFRA